MSDSEDSDKFDLKSLQNFHEEIKKCKKNPETSNMFISGWDDVDHDIDENIESKDPMNQVLRAAENGDVSTLEELLTANPEAVNAKDADGYTPIHRAAYGNHVTTISYLLSVGAKIDTKTELGWTPLHSACNWNNYQAAARLLAAGADPFALSDGEQTPMHLTAAISHCKSTLLILLLREDIVDLAKKPNKSGENPEQLARGHGIYAPLFEAVLPEVSYIHSISFTCNPYVRTEKLLNK